MTKTIDEWSAEKCGVVAQEYVTYSIGDPEFDDYYEIELPGGWTIKDPLCREIVRERYRKKGWMITFTMNSVIYQLHATEQDHEAYLYCKDSEEECITAIFEAENGSEE